MVKEKLDWGIAKSCYGTERTEVIAGVSQMMLCFTLQVTPSYLAPATWAQGLGYWQPCSPRHFHISGSSRGKSCIRNGREGVKPTTPSCLSKATVHPHPEGFVQPWSLHSQKIMMGLGRAVASGSEMPPCPSMLPRAEEQLRNVSPFPKGTLWWWHRVGAALPPAPTTPKPAVRGDSKALC